MLVREPPFPGEGGLGALIRTANQFQNSDFPTPRGYEQAVHPPFNLLHIRIAPFLPEDGPDPPPPFFAAAAH